MIVDADGERTRSAGSADGDAARAGEGVDPERAVGDGDGGAADDVQVREIIRPDLIAVAGEDAVLDVDERALAKRESGDRGAPERAAIAGLQ
jgi:hypothetical protein